MVDPATTPLGKMLLDEITPVVMVLRTPLVEESCLKNGLSLVEMFTPFCNFNNIDVPVRTSSDQPYRLHKFKLRLFYESEIRQPNLEVAKERLKQVITQAGENDFSNLCVDPSKTNNVVGSENENLPSWFQYVNKELIHAVSFSDHEAFDHPVACLLAVSSKDEQPINRFIDLFNTNKLPSLLNDGAMDPKILKHYLLVHDIQDGSSENAAKILAEMKSTFGTNDCQLLCINSSQGGQIEHQDNPWTSCKPDVSPDQLLGCYLTTDDLNEMRDIMQDLSSKHIIPYMEQKIRVLNQQVSATRKGFRNQIKNLWWRKGKEETADSPSGPTYTFSSIESQIRILGDYAFMLRDYELALSNYRLISTDYKLDKAWKRYAGVQEIMGLTYFMLDQSRKDAEYCMETAFTTYLRIGSSSLQNATRCGLWWVEMLKARDQYKEAATVYSRICGEEPLHSAVMLEQASYCYLLSKPPMLHKYGFHLVLCGDRYKKCDQVKHAIRTYKRAVSVYKGTTWSHIKDHVHFHIGQWYAFLGIYDIAVAHMLEVLACSHQSKITQELFLTNFLQIVQKTGKTFEVLKLQLPVINTSSRKVIYEDHRTYASPSAAGVKESLWSSLEEDIVPSSSTARTNWLELKSKLISKKYKESNICVAGEPIKVHIQFQNPLQIPISISSVSLICKLSVKADELKTDTNGSTSEPQNDDESKQSAAIPEMSSDISSYSLSDVDVTLGAGETVLVQPTVTPKVEGILTIVGVRWKLSGTVVGFYNFDSIIGKKKKAKRRLKAKSASDNDLKFVVIKSLPKLEGSIHPLPERVYMGDTRHLVLQLKNPSESPVKNLKMKISHPRFLNIGKQDQLNKEFPACLEKKNSDGESDALDSFSQLPQAVFSFPEEISVQGETPLLWPLWFRAAVPGKISLYITIYYEMGDISSVMKYRTLRMHYTLQVFPSLNVSFQVSPCPSRLKEFLVRMDVVNQTSSESFHLHQLSSIGQQWEISLLQPFDAIFPSESLFAGQALSCFFLLKNHGKSSASSEENSTTSPLLGNDVTLQAGTDLLFDICCSPLAAFHKSERSQGVSPQSQGGQDTVDFILISWLPKRDTVSGSSDQRHLFSHHACHCSISSTSPIMWLVDGPRTMQHNFSTSFCEINLKMTMYNSSDSAVSVCINTFDSPSSSGQSNDETALQNMGNQTGWHNLPMPNEIQVISTIIKSPMGKSRSLESVSPFIWSGSSATSIRLEPLSTQEIPLQVCIFSPGTYDLSNYSLSWNLLPVSGNTKEGSEHQSSSGTCNGYPYFVTVLQSA